MKKIFSLFAAVLFAGSMMATDVTIVPGDFTAAANSDYSVVKEGVSVAVTASTVNADQMRIFKNQSITISAESNISKIEFTCTANGAAQYGPGSFAAQEGYTFEAEGPKGTWEGSANSVAFTASTNQVRVTQIVVTLGAAPAVATPVISGNAEFTDSVIVTITCSTPEADIYYTTDGTTDPKCDCAAAPEYTQQIVLKATTTIMAAAYTGNDWSAVATKTFTKVEPVAEPTDCATAAAAALSVSGNNVLFNNGAEYSIEGYVTAIQTAYSDQYHNISFWMADTPDGGNVLQAFRAACASEAEAPVVGDKVTVTGKLTKYGTTPEFAAGCTYVIASTPVEEWTEITFAAPATADEIDANAEFEVGGLKVAITDPDNKMSIDANPVRFGTAEAFADYTHRLKTGGKTNADATKNLITITAPAAGQLRLAVRTGSGSALDRNLVIKQGGTELYNQVVVEADTIEGATAPKIYKYITVQVAAGQVVLTYPVNGLNFYSFAFKAAEVPVVVDKYYVVGSMTGWNVNEAYELVANPANEGEYMGLFTFAANDDFKVVKNDKEVWYPDGMGNNYIITEAGDYNIYFRPEGGQEGWYNGFFYVAKKEAPATLTVAEAYAIGMALDSAATSTEEYTVEGYVINAGAFSMLYHNQSWYMADDATAAASDFQAYNCYPIQGNDTLKVLNGDKVSVTGKLKKYWNKGASKFIIEFEKANATFIEMTEGDHSVVVSTEEVTVAQALAIGAALADNASTEKQYKITGYVSAINVKPADAYSDQYKNQSFWVADDATSTASTNADGAFYVYRGKPETEAEIPVGTKVEFTCTIKKYVPSGGGDAVIENADQNIVIKLLEGPDVEVADVVFEATDFAGLGKAATLDEPGGDVLLTKQGVTFHCNNAYGTDTYGVRCYKDGVVTISADTIIGKIVFDLFGTYTGGLDAEVYVNAKSWTYTMPSQARMTTISIFFGEAEVPEVEAITVAEALVIGEALELKGETTEKYTIEGYVTNIVENGMEQYGNMTFWMADQKGTAASNAEGAFEVYRGKPDVVLVEGDKVRVECTIKKFQTGETYVIESGSNAKVTKINEEGIENVVLTEKAQKVLVDGVLYIIRDNKMYNVQGIQVR